MDLRVDTDIRFLPRVGPAMAARLSRLGIHTVYDLLSYPPVRYNDFSRTTPIADLHPGETVTVRGTVTHATMIMTKKGRRMVLITIEDESGSIRIIFFNQPYLLKTLKPGTEMSAAGEVSWFDRKPTLVSPAYELTQGEEGLHTGRMVPVYHETEGVSSKWLRARISHLLTLPVSLIQDHLPDDIRNVYGLLPLSQAFASVHFPKDHDEARQAHRRLSFDELFLLQLRVRVDKETWRHTKKAKALKQDATALSRFIGSLPFRLTNDQNAGINDILADVSQAIPMNRLLAGDVGSGKTVVAAAVMCLFAKDRQSTLFMAPTQILAAQHAATLRTLLAPHDIHVSLVTGGAKQQAKAPPPGSVIVGTHALLASSFDGHDIGLVVIDEQQRFGVTQRKLLREKGGSSAMPHLLTMTATPIPRTIALTLMGNLDLSIITSMPLGRKQVKTWVVGPEKREGAYAWIQKEVANGAQVFIVCPFIEPSETGSTVRSATEEFSRLSTEIFPNLSLRLLHGRIKADDKHGILEDFRNRKFDILVATPVVEVGIDIPGATIMMIESSERFGLSQLHQLRGRVGRNDKPSYCLLFTDEEISEESKSRLSLLEKIHSGPELADADLALRGPGDLLGTRQHGISGFVYARLGDLKAVTDARDAAELCMKRHPGLTDVPLLRDALVRGTIADTNQD